MNKTELVEAIASSTELTKTDVDKVVTALVEVVTDALAKGDKVSLKGFGNFEVRTRSERTGRNPRTGETMTILSSKAPAFKSKFCIKKKLLINNNRKPMSLLLIGFCIFNCNI